LICNNSQTTNREKLRHTFEWGVPTVSADWLWVSVQTGNRKSFDSYLVQRLPSQSEEASGEQMEQSKLPNQSRLHSPKDREPINPMASNTEPRKNIESIDRDNHANPSLSENYVYENSTSNTRKNSSTSLSPAEEQAQSEIHTISLSREEPAKSLLSNNDASTGPKALDLAVSGLLKQARARSHLSNNAEETAERPQMKKRKPLLGRVGSSILTAGPVGYSRASSIDTMNEDGHGNSIDGLDAESNQNTNRVTKKAYQTFNSVVSGSGIDLYSNPPIYEDKGRVEIEPKKPDPPLTQLNYEDPDAVAMRRKLMQRAGKTENEESAKNSLVLGEFKDLEDTGGWGTGRRTRQAKKIFKVEDGLF
jgi:DNA replication regulator DPB11